MRQKIAIGIAACGFATAGLTLGSAFLDYKKKNDDDRRALIIQVQDAKEQAQTAQDTAEKMAALQRQENQHQAACSQNLGILASAESQFANLQQRHGTFLQNVKNCTTQNADPDKKSNCQILICVGFDFINKDTGESCAGVLLDRDNIIGSIKATRNALASDLCSPPSSPALEFMNY